MLLFWQGLLFWQVSAGSGGSSDLSVALRPAPLCLSAAQRLGTSRTGSLRILDNFHCLLWHLAGNIRRLFDHISLYLYIAVKPFLWVFGQKPNFFLSVAPRAPLTAQPNGFSFIQGRYLHFTAFILSFKQNSVLLDFYCNF